jgi:AmmeMemoRadiSam system protein B/AmmeMemoRadiSam system protein A
VRGRLIILLLAVSATATAASRPPAVAGAFYPGDADTLRRQVQGLLAAAPRPAQPALAVLVPHAGYVYSGATAAKAFAHLAGAEVRRVILLGPSHHMSFEGGALPARNIAAFSTPLGDVPIDRDAVGALRKRSEFQGPTDAHRPEHSLEVELPFLQLALPGVPIVPVLVGIETDRQVSRRMAEGISRLLDDRTAVVVSSDFTHHGARYGYSPFAGDPKLADTLLELGRATAERVTASDASGFWYQVEVSGDTVCGRRPLAVLSELLERSFAGSGRVIDVTTSGHVSGNWDLSVTYVAAVFDGSWQARRADLEQPILGEIPEGQGDDLLALARATLRSHLVHDASLAHWFASTAPGDVHRALAGAFVTLNNVGERARREGRLRACMGVIEAEQPLLEAVVRAATSAVYDPRFPRVQASELGELELEVSVLSPCREVPGPEAIRVGEHGVVLSKGGRRAVYLPQVAPEQGWDRDTMLDHLARKAGLPTDGWHSGARFEVFTAQVFAEER